jgi:hypothetical protein
LKDVEKMETREMERREMENGRGNITGGQAACFASAFYLDKVTFNGN